VFRVALFPRADRVHAAGVFANAPAVLTRTPDAAEQWLYRPAFAGLLFIARWLRFLQRLPVQVQVSLVMIVLAVLLIWKVTL
jgi:hypothetical protein